MTMPAQTCSGSDATLYPAYSMLGDRAPTLLSSREVECLGNAAMGLTDIHVAQILGITRSTVRFHLRNACRKLGVTNRSAAIYRAAKADYI